MTSRFLRGEGSWGLDSHESIHLVSKGAEAEVAGRLVLRGKKPRFLVPGDLHWLPFGEEGPDPLGSTPLPATVGFEPSLRGGVL